MVTLLARLDVETVDWVGTSLGGRLLEAINTADRATHKKRGLLLMEEPTSLR